MFLICYYLYMRFEKRDIVGAFVFSADNKVLLGLNRSGGVYKDQLTIPGGGVEENESYFDAMIREVSEETGVDIRAGLVEEIQGTSNGTSERVDGHTGDKVRVDMMFHDYTVHLYKNADDINLVFADDFEIASWYSASELAELSLAPNVLKTLRKLNFLN